MFQKITLLILTLGFLGACGEDPQPPNKPTVTQASATCRPFGTDNVVKLASITVRVTDLDGVEDLADVRAVVEATSLDMEPVPLTDQAPLPDCGGPDEICEVEYRWRRGANTPQIICGETGTRLQVQFEVSDVAGFTERVLITSSLGAN
ncbi:MAG: hypothetical protein CMH52_02490 [Myxococcales bacterium]|nr:hypothetical protein [Myxococcales bacterium]|tara:strand:+ start:4723 stop:5169 length:447 start_codon:yes stop_codon:yes gene_type:complete